MQQMATAAKAGVFHSGSNMGVQAGELDCHRAKPKHVKTRIPLFSIISEDRLIGKFDSMSKLCA